MSGKTSGEAPLTTPFSLWLCVGRKRLRRAGTPSGDPEFTVRLDNCQAKWSREDRRLWSGFADDEGNGCGSGVPNRIRRPSLPSGIVLSDRQSLFPSAKIRS